MKIKHQLDLINTELDSEAMYVPIHTTLPNGTQVVIDAITDKQITEMYNLIESASISGHGFGVDEYPTEKDFRLEIKDSHSFVLTDKDCGTMLAAFSLIDSKFYRGTEMKMADPIIIVRTSERGKGVGEFIFRQVVIFSKRLGFSGIYTDTFSNNYAMMRIIERTSGFQQVGHFPLAGKLPDGTFVGANLYFKDLRNNCDENTICGDRNAY